MVAVYGQILNFPEANLSNLDTILLLGISNSKFLGKSGYDKILLTIFEDIKQTNENGAYKIKFEFCAGNTPALQSMGGFVMGVGNAQNPCRECLTHKNEILDIDVEEKCRMRNRDNCEQIARELNDGQTVAGISRFTHLYDYEFFDPVTMTPQDPMHILLEGIARRIIMDFFKLWVQTKRSSLAEINLRIKNFKLHHIHKNDQLKICLKESDLYKNEFIISASQMRTLLEVFPFMFHDICDTNSPDYKLINILRKFSMIMFDFRPSIARITELKILIKAFIIEYKSCFTKAFPKLHYLVHMPKWITK